MWKNVSTSRRRQRANVRCWQQWHVTGYNKTHVCYHITNQNLLLKYWQVSRVHASGYSRENAYDKVTGRSVRNVYHNSSNAYNRRWRHKWKDCGVYSKVVSYTTFVLACFNVEMYNTVWGSDLSCCVLAWCVFFYVYYIVICSAFKCLLPILEFMILVSSTTRVYLMCFETWLDIH